MKKIFISIFLSLFLVSCFSSEKQDWLIAYSSENFSLRIPDNWEIIDNKDKSLPTPRSWNIEFVIRSKNEKNWFSNNMIILSEDKKFETTASEYINSSSISYEKDYFEYEKIDEKNINFINWNSSKILVFEARYNDHTPKIKFLQTADICNNKIFYITLAIENNISDVSRYEYMLSNFNCKK